MVLMKLKWNKLSFDNVEVTPVMTVDELKENIYRLTKVPKDRQKLMCKGAWIAVLKDNQELSQCKLEDGMQITLMGTAETVQAPQQIFKFVEEMNSSEKAVMGTIFPPGLNNLGNTCYMNSVIHCIRWIPQVKEALQSCRTDNPVVSSLSNLIRNLETTGSTITPIEFVSVIRRAFPAFAEINNSGGYVQQDAEEFYNALNAELGRDDHIRNIYNDAMEISLEEKLECLESTSEPAVTRTDKMFKLICNIQGGAGAAANIDYMRDGIKLGLQTTIEKFSESLQRNAQYKKSLSISKLPKSICVQFMRFFWKATPESRDHAGVKCKILRNVAFHDKFDAYEFCNESLQQQIREARKEDGNETGVYELIALVSHKGRSADSGHYIGYTRQQPGQNMWWIFDDSKVSETTTDEILKLSGGGDRDMAYLCFFRHLA